MSADPIGEAVALHQQAVTLRAEHRIADAESAARRALALLRLHGDVGGADGPDAANVLLSLAAIRRQAGDVEEAEVLGREAELLCRSFPADGGDVDRVRVHALQGLGDTLRVAGR